VPGLLPKVADSLRKRIQGAHGTSILPLLSYSSVAFAIAADDHANPWAQAATLLYDMATYMRKALTDRRFFLGIQVSEDALLDAMNVADDHILQLPGRQASQRAMGELDQLNAIHQSAREPRRRCELILRVIKGGDPGEIDRDLEGT